MDNKDIIKYAKWIIHECDSPIDEIEWLVQQILDTKNSREDIISDFKNNIIEVNQNKDK